MQRAYHQRATYIVRTETVEPNRVAKAIVGNRQCIRGLSEGQIRLRDAGAELDAISFAGRGDILNHVKAVAKVKRIGVVAGAANQHVVALTTNQRVVAIQAIDPVHDISAGDKVVPCRAREVKAPVNQVAVAQHRAVRELERLDVMGTVGIKLIEIHQMDRIALVAVVEQQRAEIQTQRLRRDALPEDDGIAVAP